VRDKPDLLPAGVTLADYAGVSMEAIVRCARLAEDLGYQGFWITEDNVRDAFLVVDRVARGTSRILVGTSVTSAYARTPTALALTAATIQNAAEGRFVLGVGTGGLGFVTRGHGVPLKAPVARMRETVEIVRALVRGDRLNHRGRFFHVQDFRLREPANVRVPLYLAALNRRMSELAGEVADGVIANFLTPERFDDQLLPWLRAGASRADRTATPAVATLALAPGDPGSEESIAAVRQRIAFYGTSQHYFDTLRSAGFEERTRRFRERWLAGDREGATSLVTVEMAERLTLSGSEEQVATRLRAYADRRIVPLVYPVTRRGAFIDDFEATITRIADAYRARVPRAMPP
jgi:alkanesulfonate monooxygenase SsuD/methylene tetrahydromethanopterin reductase-like flavin-dependent oxidoreductase (luciferase family)